MDQREYIEAHTASINDALRWVEKETHLRTNYPQMLAGPTQGEFLKMLVELMGAHKVLEIGTFTGYSAICLAAGLPDDGHLDTLEVNDEMEVLIREGFSRSGLSGRITLHLGDALETLQSLPKDYDLVFIDADKRQYDKYYGMVVEMVRKGGLIVADDVLWAGKPFEEPMPQDAQTQGIARYNDMAASDPRVESLILPLRHGLSLLRRL